METELKAPCVVRDYSEENRLALKSFVRNTFLRTPYTTNYRYCCNFVVGIDIIITVDDHGEVCLWEYSHKAFKAAVVEGCLKMERIVKREPIQQCNHMLPQLRNLMKGHYVFPER